MPDYTRWLNASTSSRDEEMFAGLYAELHKIARGRMAAERADGTLEATANCPEIEIVDFMPRPGSRSEAIHQAARGSPPPRVVRKKKSSMSCRIPVVVAKQSAKPLAALHLPFFRRSELRRDDFIRSIDGA